jgi:hypothetical protein
MNAHVPPDAEPTDKVAGKTKPGTFRVSFFKDFAAKEIRTADLTLVELQQRILSTSAKNKEALPWLKLAYFGKTKTDKGSLRHDRNLLRISGCEFDYDGSDDPKIPGIGFAEAVEMVRKMNIKALVYTTPTYT